MIKLPLGLSPLLVIVSFLTSPSPQLSLPLSIHFQHLITFCFPRPPLTHPAGAHLKRGGLNLSYVPSLPPPHRPAVHLCMFPSILKLLRPHTQELMQTYQD